MRITVGAKGKPHLVGLPRWLSDVRATERAGEWQVSARIAWWIIPLLFVEGVYLGDRAAKGASRTTVGADRPRTKRGTAAKGKR